MSLRINDYKIKSSDNRQDKKRKEDEKKNSKF